MSTERVRLSRFRILAYRSCRDTQLSIDTDVTALIGPNGAGKTNLLHGLLLLRNPRRRFYAGSDEETYTRECKVQADFAVGKKRVLLEAVVIYRPTEQNLDELVSVHERWNFKEITGRSQWKTTEEIVFGSKNRARTKDPLWRRSMLHVSNSVFLSEGLKLRGSKINKAFRAIQQFRSGISYYSASQFTNPALCPTSIEIDEDGDLSEDYTYRRQSAHTRFVYDLYKLSRENKDAYNRYVSLIDDEGVSLVKSVKWREVKLSSQAYEVRAGGRVITKRKTRTMIIPTAYVGASQLSLKHFSPLPVTVFSRK